MPQRNSGEHRPEEACPGERPDADQEAVDHQVDEQVGTEVALLLEPGHRPLPQLLTSHLPAQPSTGRAAPHEDDGLPFPGPWAAGPREPGPREDAIATSRWSDGATTRSQLPLAHCRVGGPPQPSVTPGPAALGMRTCPVTRGCNQARASGDSATIRCHRCRLFKHGPVGLDTRYRAKAQVPGGVVWRAR